MHTAIHAHAGPPHRSRRLVLKFLGAAAIAGVAVRHGLVATARAVQQVAWPKEAFEQKSETAALQAFYDGRAPELSDKVTLDAPEIAEILRLVLGWAWTYVIVAELIGSSSGIGHMIIDSQALLATGQMIFGIIVIGLIGLVSDFAFMGGNDAKVGETLPDPGGPTIHIKLISIMGGSDIQRGRKLSRAERKAKRHLERGGH